MSDGVCSDPRLQSLLRLKRIHRKFAKVEGEIEEAFSRSR